MVNQDNSLVMQLKLQADMEATDSMKFKSRKMISNDAVALR